LPVAPAPAKPAELASREYWDATWADEKPHDYEGPVNAFHPLFARLLPKGSNLRLLELGSARGYALVYFHKEFGYEVHGVDASAEGMRVAEAHCRHNGVDAHLYVGDLFEVDVPGPFDVVFSGGLVEHFDDLDRVVRRHVQWVKPGGLLVLGVPNVRGFHARVMRHYEPENYAIHNVASCSPYALRSSIERVEPGWRYLFCGYGGGFHFFYPVPGFLRLVERVVSKALRTLRIQRVPNRWFAPDAFVIARRPLPRGAP
jgi:2-polyprenyl-3-methyl-5-hydroxy-6-metoxy-1,4-benzoquinol methylase